MGRQRGKIKLKGNDGPTQNTGVRYHFPLLKCSVFIFTIMGDKMQVKGQVYEHIWHLKRLLPNQEKNIGSQRRQQKLFISYKIINKVYIVLDWIPPVRKSVIFGTSLETGGCSRQSWKRSRVKKNKNCAGATLENYGVKTNTNKANVRYFYPNVRINKKRNE